MRPLDEPDGTGTSSAPTVDANSLKYTLDRDWFVRSVHGYPESEPCRSLVGHNIFAIISDVSLRELLRVIFQKVYDFNKFVYLNYRCDTPELRRYCVMRVERRRTDVGLWVAVENRTILAQPRARVKLLEESQLHSEERLVMCSWCKKIRMADTDWCEVEESVERLGLMKCTRLPKLSHAMCPACVDYLSYEAQVMETRATDANS